MLKKHIHLLKKAKLKPSEQAHEIHRCQLCSDWPQTPSSELKCHLVQMFKDETSSAKLATFTCACCAESALHADCVIASPDDFDLSLLHRPDHQNDQHIFNDYFDKDCPLPQLPFSESDSPLHDLMINPAGVRQSDTGKFQLLLCSLCHKKLNKGK
jgi:hypothetical protein